MFFFRQRGKKLPSDHPPSSRDVINREAERIDFETPIFYENYETKEIARGYVLNYSNSGLCIEAEHCPAAGQGALIYMKNYSPKSEGPNYIKKHHVQVRWVKPISDTKATNRCAIGVRYCKDIDELFRLFGH